MNVNVAEIEAALQIAILLGNQLTSFLAAVKDGKVSSQQLADFHVEYLAAADTLQAHINQAKGEGR